MFPCKWLHATGKCEKGNRCRFNHETLNLQEIQKFMKENEAFLDDLFGKQGYTNLGTHYETFRKQKIAKA